MKISSTTRQSEQQQFPLVSQNVISSDEIIRLPLSFSSEHVNQTFESNANKTFPGVLQMGTLPPAAGGGLVVNQIHFPDGFGVASRALIGLILFFQVNSAHYEQQPLCQTNSELFDCFRKLISLLQVSFCVLF